MRAGRLRHRVELFDAEVVLDHIGQDLSPEVSLGVYWASVRPIRGEESSGDRQVIAKTQHVVTLRRQPTAVLPHMRFRIVGTDRILEITSVLDLDERGATTECVCTEQAPQS